MSPSRGKTWLWLITASVTVQILGFAAVPARVISLSGSWRFRLDPDGIGLGKRWFAEKLDDTVVLPGSTDTNGKGIFKNERVVDRLSRVWDWKGPAWYQRDVVVPESWRGKRITLLLERTKTTRVWADDVDCGAEDTLSAPQIFDLTRVLTPGRHTITVLVDNAKLPPVGPSHAVDERTQTNWNGIVGRMELRATDPVWLDEVQVYPDVGNRRATIRAVVGNIAGEAASGRIEISGRSWNTPAPASFPARPADIGAPRERNEIAIDYELGRDAPLWDEFHPALIRLSIVLEAKAGSRSFRDERTVDFGLRTFVREGSRLKVNGRTVVLRGRVDSCLFPATGYAPMDKASWFRLMTIAKSYGLNHYRFHSWFPPEAALEAADELGLYLAPELPNKSSRFEPPAKDRTGSGAPVVKAGAPPAATPLAAYLAREGELVFKAFGNHPSFVMYTLGNELERWPAMFDLVASFKRLDPRRLYAQGSNNVHWAPSLAEGDDFWVTARTGDDLPVRGAFFPGDFAGGHIENRPPSTLVDYGASIAGVPVPVIAHEIGEKEVAPDFREIPKYEGVLKARNLEIFRDRLKAAGMLDQAGDFVRASGALAAICYREEIEAALRTPGFGGFQLLDLQDFSGQGTALVGMLNVFMESKGIIEPAAWREFCSETVPLVRMEKYVWTADETFRAEIEVAHYGPADIPRARIAWTLGEGSGRTLASGALGPAPLKQGEVSRLGRIEAPLDRARVPAKLRLTAAIEGTAHLNRYHLWVYPSKVDTAAPPDVFIGGRLDADARLRLASGGKVVLFPGPGALENTVGGAFETDFWCWPMFARAAEQRGIPPAPGTQGFLCDPGHPALADFPTEFHSNWQWWHLVKNARPIILDETPADFRPVIQGIDNFARNHKLGLLFEARVGAGKLLVWAGDLPSLQAHPEARQLMHSLLRYAGSERFQPRRALDAAAVERILGSPAEGRERAK
jgi:hypothetical protein